MAEKIRLQKYFTDCGILSRRAAEAEIAKGRVTVNGAVASVGDKIDPDCDVVVYAGKHILARTDKAYRYVMLNKPCGYVTTASDEKGRKTVLELVRGVGTRIYPVGRLDLNSQGLLLLTNDGELTNHLTHPRHEIPKIYRVAVSPAPSDAQLSLLASPMELDGYQLLPVGVKKITENELELTLFEGRNRQIRRMCDAVGLKVVRLERIAIGDVRLGDLPLGRWRELTAQEVAYLTAKQQEKE